MNDPRRLRRFAALWAAVLALQGCAQKSVAVPEMSDPPVVEAAVTEDLPDTIPAYGIALLRDGVLTFEMNIEAEDTGKLRIGEPCTAFIPPGTVPIPCSVSRILRNVSAETGESLAWLKPRGDAAVPANEFIYATITTSMRRGVLTVPRAALLVRGGRTYVIREAAAQGNASYAPVEVRTGISYGKAVEILSGVAPKDRVVTSGGVGYLYPDFKSQADD